MVSGLFISEEIFESWVWAFGPINQQFQDITKGESISNTLSDWLIQNGSAFFVYFFR